ncbi:MAG TPA: acetyl-CoA C-acetyltransferase [Cytophagales bacterium]|nr:acetyl-CoA C-acetyltransferase [Cytophagales bacterium]HAA19004.1 acetyl-CoA C-acetyltransferase [Cytophagales bacterium]
MKEVYIVSAVRTPIGSFGGMFASVTATQLGSAAMKGVLEKAGVDAKEIQEVYFGNVVSSGLGQAPARQAALGAGLSSEVPCTTVNKVCSSGMKSVMMGAQSIMLGHNDVVMAGGMESMTNVPYYIPKARSGYKYGHGQMLDGLMHDGLWEPYHQFPMGSCADNTAKEMNISREAQDEYAINSYKRSAESWANGKFADEVIPVAVPQRRGDDLILSEDEEYKAVKFEKIPGLRPVFNKDGSVTAANASTINDGASAILLMSKEKVEELGVKPIAKILSFGDAAQDPLWFTTAPSKAIPVALGRAGLEKKDVQYWEINEAFSAVALANAQELDIDQGILNVNGGSVALGHPLGASGARILTTLTSVLKQNDASVGVAGICNGGGGASAIAIERLN